MDTSEESNEREITNDVFNDLEKFSWEEKRFDDQLMDTENKNAGECDFEESENKPTENNERLGSKVDECDDGLMHTENINAGECDDVES